MYMLSNKYLNPGWWTEIQIDKYGLEMYMLSNKYLNPGWWTEISINKYGLRNVYAFKQVSESGLVDRNKNRQIWFDKCICFQTCFRIRAGGTK